MLDTARSGRPAKHHCALAAVSEISLASELCTAARPYIMNQDKVTWGDTPSCLLFCRYCTVLYYVEMSLHYVIHYIKRGYWDGLVPEPTKADRPRIEGLYWIMY